MPVDLRRTTICKILVSGKAVLDCKLATLMSNARKSQDVVGGTWQHGQPTAQYSRQQLQLGKFNRQVSVVFGGEIAGPTGVTRVLFGHLYT